MKQLLLLLTLLCSLVDQFHATTTRPTSFISGRTANQVGQYSWVARVRYKRDNAPETWPCSAIFVGDSALITSSNCILRLGSGAQDSPSPDQLLVRLGSHFFGKDQYIDMEVDRVVHENTYPIRAAIALIMLKRKLEFRQPTNNTAGILPAILPPRNIVIKPYDYVNASGWFEDQHREPEIPMQVVNIKLTPCYEVSVEKEELYMCSKIVGKSDHCFDSMGSGILYYDSSSRINYLVGVSTRFEPGICGKGKNYLIFTRIAPLLSFINQNIHKHKRYLRRNQRMLKG